MNDDDQPPLAEFIGVTDPEMNLLYSSMPTTDPAFLNPDAYSGNISGPSSHSQTPSSSTSPATSKPTIQRSTEVKQRACTECRKRKIACYMIDNGEKCFRCQMEDIDCVFSDAPLPKSTVKPIPLQTKPNVEAGTGPIEDYSMLPGRSLLKRTLSLQHPRSSFVVGKSGVFDAQVLGSVPLDKQGQARISPNLVLRRISNDTLFLLANDGELPQWVRECDELEKTVAPHGRALVNCYFQNCQPIYPILHEKVFVEKYMRTHRELTPALLGAVYIQAIRFWYHSPELSTSARPGHLVSTIYELAMAAFFRASGKPSLSLIQAGLLLMQCVYSDTRHAAVVSVITATAYRLALNRNCLSWKLPRWEKELRVRLAWAVFSQNKWASLIESMPSLIDERTWVQVPLSEENFETGGMAPSANKLFIHFMKLSVIVGEVQKYLLYEDADADANMEQVLQEIKPLQVSLHKWHRELPEELALDYREGPTSAANFSLHVAYISVEACLHRFIIRQVSVTKCEPDLADICRQAAHTRLVTAMDLAMSLRIQHVQAFCHFSFAYQLALIGLFAALMYTTSRKQEESDFYSQYLTDYVRVLRELSEAEVVAAAVHLLVSSIAGVPGLPS